MSIIRLTDKCNEKCVFCNYQEKLPILSLAEIKNKLIELRLKDNNVTFSGGEPTLHPDLNGIIAFAKKLNFSNIEIQTNAVLLADKEKVSDLKDFGLNGAFVPLLFYNAEISDELTQAPSCWVKTLKGIENLLNAGIETSINIVITSKNYNGLLTLTKFIHKKLPEISSIDYSFVVSDGRALKNSNIVPKISRVIPYLLMAYKYCEDNNINFSNPGCGVPVCFLPKKYQNISLEYNSLKDRVGDNEFIVVNQPNKIKLEKCQSCESNNYCLGIWRGYIKIHGQSEFI